MDNEPWFAVVDSSGGQDNMPRHLRVFVGAVTPKEDEEAIDSDVIVVDNLLLLEARIFCTDELVKAEPRTALEDFAGVEEPFGTDPRTALVILVDVEEWLVEIDLVVE